MIYGSNMSVTNMWSTCYVPSPKTTTSQLTGLGHAISASHALGLLQNTKYISSCLDMWWKPSQSLAIRLPNTKINRFHTPFANPVPKNNFRRHLAPINNSTKQVKIHSTSMRQTPSPWWCRQKHTPRTHQCDWSLICQPHQRHPGTNKKTSWLSGNPRRCSPHI